MPYNLFISYDLAEKEDETRDYEPIENAINKLGAACHIQYSQYYVCSNVDGHAAAEYLVENGELREGELLDGELQGGDRLLVIDTTSDNCISWGIGEAKEKFIQDHWVP